ncbi:MAG: DsbA family oxidoreductase [Cyclobacteriaceae bacterium]
MSKERIKIGVVSDVVCPWCYIGKRRLEKAIHQSSERFDFEVEYFPFELNPHMDENGADYRQYLINKFGSESKFHELTRHVKQIAEQEGLIFNMELQQVSPNTRNAHRIILIAKEEDKQSEVTEAFFKAYFTEGTDLSKTENLLDIAEQAGLDRMKLEQLLDSSTGKIEIEMAEKELYDLGITGVPLYIIDNKFAISGAQSVEAFTQAFEEVAMEKVGQSEV